MPTGFVVLVPEREGAGKRRVQRGEKEGVLSNKAGPQTVNRPNTIS